MEDTDTLLALVCSQLSEPWPEQDVILDALVSCNGNVETTVKQLKKASTNSKKRKRAQLDDWFRRSGPAPVSPQASSSKIPGPLIVKSTSKSGRATTDLKSVLRPPPSSEKKPQQLPPLLLSTPEMIAENTPCTMHLSVLPQELACHLFYTMIRASKDWKRNRWWLFDRVVESPHKTAFFARNLNVYGEGDEESLKESARFWYNGRQTDPPELFPPAMEEACEIIEKLVNEQIRLRPHRYPLEYAGDGANQSWRANVAASNCYEGSKESVGPHSDQLTQLGPYPTIASLSLGTQRVFSLREVVPTEEATSRKARTYNLSLPHNSLVIMHASCQERFKHSIPPQPTIDLYRPMFPEDLDWEFDPSNCRINITFRFYRPDFKPPSIPKCKCGIPTILRPDMKNRTDGKTDRYWWTCYAGAQNEGKGCNFWKVMNMDEEGRGPCVKDVDL